MRLAPLASMPAIKRPAQSGAPIVLEDPPAPYPVRNTVTVDVPDAVTQLEELSVIEVPATRLAIVQPPAIPVPSTGMPGPSISVDVNAMVALPDVRVPFAA